MAALSLQTVIGVVGTGAMGAGIAQVAAAAGHPVRLFDNRAGAAEQAVGGIRQQFEKLAVKGKLSVDDAAAASGRLKAVDSLQDLADCGLVVEAIVEKLEAKQGLYSELEGIVGPDCIFGTNTSSISVTAIGAALKRPQRLAGMHFFNPAPLMKLVEIVAGLATDAVVAETLFDTATAWGKRAVHAKSTPGFIVNRVARPYYAEALRVVQEGAADHATIDAVMRDAGGFRMGPFELMDMIGHDVNFAVTKSVWSAYFYDKRFQPSLLQQELVEAGFLGRKNGRGFFDYSEGASKPKPHAMPSAAAPASVAICGESPAAQGLAQRLHLQGIDFSRKPAHADARIAEAGEAVMYLTDGRTAARRAAQNGVENTILVDLALDYTQATRVALTAAAGARQQAVQDAMGLLQAAGLVVSPLKDVPGMAVMRTVAMLANEAADAVNQGVCSAGDADAAMQLGVNYPLGPLLWAEQVGLPAVRDVLANLGSIYGEDRYRISPLLQQRIDEGRKFHE